MTGTLAARVRGLRRSGGLSQAELGERMAELGAAWSRTVVAQVESGRRETVTVPELLALALAFRVPVTALLVDESAERVTVAEGHEYHPVDVLLWLIAERPLPGTGRRVHLPGDFGVVEPKPWTDAAWPAWRARQLLLARDAALGARQRALDAMDRGESQGDAELLYSERLSNLGKILAGMAAEGMAVPAVDEPLAADAARRGLTLPAPAAGEG